MSATHCGRSLGIAGPVEDKKKETGKKIRMVGQDVD